MLIGELAKRLGISKSTLDRYVRFGLIIPCEGSEDDYRQFDEEAEDRGGLIRILTKRPFRLDLEDIKAVFEKVPISQLVAKKNISIKTLHRLLSDKDLL